MWKIAYCLITLVLYIHIHNVNGDCCTSVTCPPPRQRWGVREAFVKYQIMEDYVPVPPNDLLELKYGDLQCLLGNIINPLGTYRRPSVTRYRKGEHGELYTVMFLDIDAPSRDISDERARIGLLYMNGPSNDLLSGDMVIDYQAASPNVGTGFHRLVGLVYKQNGTIDTDQPELLRLSRTNTGFSAISFADTYGLGDPVAGCFWLAENTACGIKDEE